MIPSGLAMSTNAEYISYCTPCSLALLFLSTAEIRDSCKLPHLRIKVWRPGETLCALSRRLKPWLRCTSLLTKSSGVSFQNSDYEHAFFHRLETFLVSCAFVESVWLPPIGGLGAKSKTAFEDETPNRTESSIHPGTARRLGPRANRDCSVMHWLRAPPLVRWQHRGHLLIQGSVAKRPPQRPPHPPRPRLLTFLCGYVVYASRNGSR